MIERLELTNFQCHQTFAVDLESVTVFVGATDRGKSTLCRAVRWVCMNEGSAASLTRHGCEAVAATLVVDGQPIVRRRDKTGNHYEFGGVSFAAVGRAVPQAIESFLNVTDINFQGQHDSPFWLGASGGAVGRELNAVVDLGVIDQAMTNAAAACRQTATAATAARQVLDAAIEEVASLAWVTSAAIAWEAVLLAEKDKVEAALDAEKLQLAITTVQAAANAARTHGTAAKALLGVATAARDTAAAWGRTRALAGLLAEARQTLPVAPDAATVAAIGTAGRKAQIKWDRKESLRLAYVKVAKLNSSLDFDYQLLATLDEGLAEYSTCPACGNLVQA